MLVLGLRLDIHLSLKTSKLRSTFPSLLGMPPGFVPVPLYLTGPPPCAQLHVNVD